MLALLRGPLFQRASAVKSDAVYDTWGSVQVAIAQKFPPDYTGIAVQTRASTREIARLTPVFAEVMQDYSLRRNISISYDRCGNSCETIVRVSRTPSKSLRGTHSEPGLRIQYNMLVRRIHSRGVHHSCTRSTHFRIFDLSVPTWRIGSDGNILRRCRYAI